MDVDSNSQERIDQAIDYLGKAKRQTDKSQAKELYKLASHLSGLKINKRNIQESLDFLKAKSRRAPTYEELASPHENETDAYHQWLQSEYGRSERHQQESPSFFCGTIKILINELSDKINSLQSYLYGNTITEQGTFNLTLNGIKEIMEI